MRIALLGLLTVMACSCAASSAGLKQRDFGQCKSLEVVAELAGKEFTVFGCENGDLVLIPLAKKTNDQGI